MEIGSTIGERIKYIRKLKGLSQAKCANFLNISQSFLSDIENNNTIPGNKALESINRYFKISIDWLLTGQGEMFLKDTPAIQQEAIPPAQGDETPATPSQVSDAIEKVIAKYIKEGKIKLASPTDPGIKRPLIRLAQCGSPAKIAYDTGEFTTIASRYEYIDMVVLTEGDSMKEEGILPGAMVYIKKQDYCKNGEIVLLVNHDFPDEPRLALKKARNNGKGMAFVNGQGDVMTMGEKIEILGVAKAVVVEF